MTEKDADHIDRYFGLDKKLAVGAGAVAAALGIRHLVRRHGRAPQEIAVEQEENDTRSELEKKIALLNEGTPLYSAEELSKMTGLFAARGPLDYPTAKNSFITLGGYVTNNAERRRAALVIVTLQDNGIIHSIQSDKPTGPKWLMDLKPEFREQLDAAPAETFLVAKYRQLWQEEPGQNRPSGSS